MLRPHSRRRRRNVGVVGLLWPCAIDRPGRNRNHGARRHLRVCLSTCDTTEYGSQVVGTPSPESLGWLSGYSEPALRSVLRATAPEFADLPFAFEGTPDLNNPTWASSRATIGGRVFAKFALSEQTAVRIWREAQALGFLRDELGLAVPKLVAASRNPAFSSTEW